MWIKQPTTKAKTGVTQCGKNDDEKFKKNFIRIINGNTSNSFSQNK
jgi:hypothetical protein